MCHRFHRRSTPGCHAARMTGSRLGVGRHRRSSESFGHGSLSFAGDRKLCDATILHVVPFVCGARPGPSLSCDARSGPSLSCDARSGPSLSCDARSGPSLSCDARPGSSDTRTDWWPRQDRSGSSPASRPRPAGGRAPPPVFPNAMRLLAKPVAAAHLSPARRPGGRCRRFAGDGGKSGLHGNTVPANSRRGRPQGQCHREQTARAPQDPSGGRRVRVKGCGKSAPRPW